MPAVKMKVTWPDGECLSYYSPSTVIYDFFKTGRTYDLFDFHERINKALTQASERVREKYGFACSAAADELEIIVGKINRLLSGEYNNDSPVKIESFY